MKRIISFICAVLLLTAACGSAEAVSTGASSAILMDADSGRILYEQNIHDRRPIASITKLMTALVAVEQIEDLEKTVVIQPEWTGIEGSSIYLRPNEEVTIKELLYGLLLQSGNDAAEAIAGYVAGDTDSFAGLMNRRAGELGMKNSHFTNPSGLNDKEHYSTAYDMALLAQACLANKLVAEICAAQHATAGSRTFYNHNKLLNRYEGCVGMKTGYTEHAGRTLVSAAVRNGQTLICVTLNDGNDWNDHEKLLDYGFETYPLRTLCAQGAIFGGVKVIGSLIPSLQVVAAEGLSYPLREGETPKLTIELTKETVAPVKAQTFVGKAVWTLGGTAIAETTLVCAGSAEKHDYEGNRLWERFFSRTKITAARNGAHLI